MKYNNNRGTSMIWIKLATCHENGKKKNELTNNFRNGNGDNNNQFA